MKKKILTIIGITLLITLAISLVAHAQIPEDLRPINEPFNPDFEENSGASATITILQILAGGLLYIAAPLAIIMIALTALNMVMGGADSEKLEQSKKSITWLIIGLLVVILSYSLVRFVISFMIESATAGNKTTPQAVEITQLLS